jgi:hypothetical protein
LSKIVAQFLCDNYVWFVEFENALKPIFEYFILARNQCFDFRNIFALKICDDFESKLCTAIY